MVFISYSSKDNSSAVKVNARLKKSGFKTWFAEQNIGVGENYAKDIVKGIQSAQCIVLLYSNDADSSVHVQKELDLALKYRKKIYPLRIEDTESKEAMEYFLSGTQYIDIFKDFDKGLKNFIDFLSSELGIKEDFTKKLDSTNIELFAIKHFKAMGYKISPKDRSSWEEHSEVSRGLGHDASHKESILGYLGKHCFYASKENKKLIVAPIFLESSSVPYMKAYEADLFWKARRLLWHEDDLKDALGVYNAPASMVDDDEIEFKLKSNIADLFRNPNRYKHKINILFYLYIKTPPEYKSMSYSIPLIGKYKEGEKMPNLYLNYTFRPVWWGYGKDDLEGIPGERYLGFGEAFDKVRFGINRSSRAEYEHYDGRVAETLAEVFLKRNDLVVQKFGAESLLGNSITFMERAKVLEDVSAADTIRKFMTSPDLLVIKLNTDNEIINSFMMDVKYRSFKNKSAFLKQLSPQGELYSQAKKYKENWDSIYLLLFSHLREENDVEIYFLPVQDMLSEKFQPIKIEDDVLFGWLDNGELATLYKQSKQFWL